VQRAGPGIRAHKAQSARILKLEKPAHGFRPSYPGQSVTRLGHVPPGYAGFGKKAGKSLRYRRRLSFRLQRGDDCGCSDRMVGVCPHIVQPLHRPSMISTRSFIGSGAVALWASLQQRTASQGAASCAPSPKRTAINFKAQDKAHRPIQSSLAPQRRQLGGADVSFCPRTRTVASPMFAAVTADRVSLGAAPLQPLHRA